MPCGKRPLGMPCGKRPLRKLWDKPKDLRIVKPSRYQQNEPCVKQHWKNVIKNLEMSYKDEQFWKTNYQTVRELVDPLTYERIAKIFNLPLDEVKYQPKDSDDEDLVPSENYYTAARSQLQNQVRSAFSMGSYESSLGEELDVEEEQSEWSNLSTVSPSIEATGKSRSKLASKSTINKSYSKGLTKSLSKFLSKSTSRSMSSKFTSRAKISPELSPDATARSDDDLLVHPRSVGTKHRRRAINNPHFDMLYCNESETDMIKWASKYKQKTFEISASDEFSKKAELITKKIANEFYDWWVGLGNVEFKSEIKRPQDIEDLFQVWFEEHASRGLVIDPKILPCVLESVANAVGIPKASCPSALERQIAWDIQAETSPAHTMAFGTCLPQKKKHIPPKNNTEETWHCVKIPNDLRTMETVWGDIKHLTSTKAFQKWLDQRAHMPMPACLRDLDARAPKQQLFAVPSDYVVRDIKSTEGFSAHDLAIPVSQFSIEIKEVLSRLLND